MNFVMFSKIADTFKDKMANNELFETDLDLNLKECWLPHFPVETFLSSTNH